LITVQQSDIGFVSVLFQNTTGSSCFWQDFFATPLL